jgi:RimJ/RimL family protein N-acetyltransferase
MKDNENLVIEGDKLLLVPYEAEHVPRYHEWMADPFLQETTASEPLTIEEEYEMQQSWRNDKDKCTFIILDKSTPDTPGVSPQGGAMAGDTNIFLNDSDRPDHAEIEIMIAEPSSRGKGLAMEALQLFMAYAVSKLGIRLFTAKIGMSNAPSLALFAKLGYTEVKRVEVFQEVHLQLAIEGDVLQQMLTAGAALQNRAYRDA